ncbi:MAG: hypothetical protein DRQ51_07595 [Gammaproteobacteria bacterium]|nr:MAG: hypothetical protein DRQ51_07595 [Gammaproteobacteria bacterium]
MTKIFQTQVLNKFIKEQQEQNPDLIQQRYQKFKEYQNKKDDVKKFKEEKYQDGFLTDVFENCLGYTKDTTTLKNFNLEREKQNSQDTKKADAAIIINNEVIGVIELKSYRDDNRTLYKHVPQLFNYLTSHQNCQYAIISNFDEIRFYIQDQTAFEKFNLFEMDEEEFYKLHTILSYESLKDNIPQQIKQKSVHFDKDISEQFYKDYVKFRTTLYDNIIKNNLKPIITNERSGMRQNFLKQTTTQETATASPRSDEQSVIASEPASACDIKPPCAGVSVIASEPASVAISRRNHQLKLLNLTQKLIDRIVFILFAEDTNLLPTNTIPQIIKNHESQVTDLSLFEFYKIYFKAINEGNKKLNINQYNGGLFADDTTLNNLKIDDEVLQNQAAKLSAYNFGSDISVNILGSIFERNIAGIEELTAQIQNIPYDPKQSERKKKGAFYTPEYITKYIVDNTIGTLCQNKKEQLKITNIQKPKNHKKLNLQETQTKENLTEYKNWLLDLKILDPACGSGAFLNQALEFLITEHKTLQEDFLLFRDIFHQHDINKSILENNLYGVDINEAATEIAKLSLWLKTADNRRPLTKLANKIKCGNSLIDDKTITENAFNWQAEFPEVFKNGGFDVVIGNPPYVRNTMLSKTDKKFYNKNYFVAHKQYDLYVLFNELALKITKNNARIGFIQPNKFLSADYGINTINFIAHNSDIMKIYNVSLDKVFEDASVYPYVFIFKKNTFDSNIKVSNLSIFNVCKKENLIGFENQIKSNKIIDRIFSLSNKLSEHTDSIKRGIPNKKIILSDDGVYNAVSSTDLLSPYSITKISNKITYKNKKYESERKNEFDKNIILLPRTVLKIRAILSDKNTHILDRIYYITLKENIDIDIKTMLLLLNSNLTTFYYNYLYGSTKIGGGYIDLKGTQISNFVIPKSIKDQKPFIQKADTMLELNKKLQEIKQKFIKRIMANFTIEKLTNKLKLFYNYDFKIFIDELKKKKITLKLSEQDEWEEYFDNYKTQINTIQTQINQTDNEINQMVYKLYNLTDDEIKIVES